MSGVTAISVSTETPAAPVAEAPARPEYIPEKFWKGNLEESTKLMAASYSELEKKQSSGKTEGTTATKADATPPVVPSTETPAATTEAPIAADPAVVKAIESTLATAAGSPETLGTMLGWAKANATDAQKAAFDAALDTGNAALVEMAFGPIKQAYSAAMGTQGTRVTGESIPTTVGPKPFASQQEIVEFVNSKPYKSGDRRAHAEYESRMKVTNW
jgi:hypothetical protein